MAAKRRGVARRRSYASPSAPVETSPVQDRLRPEPAPPPQRLGSESAHPGATAVPPPPNHTAWERPRTAAPNSPPGFPPHAAADGRTLRWKPKAAAGATPISEFPRTASPRYDEAAYGDQDYAGPSEYAEEDADPALWPGAMPPPNAEVLDHLRRLKKREQRPEMPRWLMFGFPAAALVLTFSVLYWGVGLRNQIILQQNTLAELTRQNETLSEQMQTMGVGRDALGADPAGTAAYPQSAYPPTGYPPSAYPTAGPYGGPSGEAQTWRAGQGYRSSQAWNSRRPDGAGASQPAGYPTGSYSSGSTRTPGLTRPDGAPSTSAAEDLFKAGQMTAASASHAASLQPEPIQASTPTATASAHPATPVSLPSLAAQSHSDRALKPDPAHASAPSGNGASSIASGQSAHLRQNAAVAKAGAAGSATGALRPATPAQPPKQIVLSSGVVNGYRISGMNPTYPEIARAAGVQGTVALQATISETGQIENLKVLQGPVLLRQAALDAVKTWRYKPYLLSGNPVAVQTTINVVFSREH